MPKGAGLIGNAISMASPANKYMLIIFNVLRAASVIAMILTIAGTIVAMHRDATTISSSSSPSHPASNSTSFVSNSTSNLAIRASTNTSGVLVAADLKQGYFAGTDIPVHFGGEFWVHFNRVIDIFFLILLIMSETVPFVDRIFQRFFPILSNSFGTWTTGFFQIWIAIGVLTAFIPNFLQVSALFLLVVGILNLLLGVIFRSGLKAKRSPWAQLTTNEASKSAPPAGPPVMISNPIPIHDYNQRPDWCAPHPDSSLEAGTYYPGRIEEQHRENQTGMKDRLRQGVNGFMGQGPRDNTSAGGPPNVPKGALLKASQAVRGLV